MIAPRLRALAAALFTALVLIGIPLPAFAGSYLDRAAILLDEARKEGDMLQPRTQDKEMVLVIQALAEARVRVARKMEIPAAVAKAHPHLMLVLESYERAVEAAAEGSFGKFMEHLNTARDEEKIFRGVLGELGYSVPDLNQKR
ncbi:MAG: hypothetical protein U0359_04055 [Byssovorax sp.]